MTNQNKTARNTTARLTTEASILTRAKEVLALGYTAQEIGRMTPTQLIQDFQRQVEARAEAFMQTASGSFNLFAAQPNAASVSEEPDVEFLEALSG